ATASAPFAPQPVVRIEDAFGNLVGSDNGRLITATRATGSAALQGNVTAGTVNGIATFTNLSYNVAETISLNFAAAGLTGVDSSNAVVRPAPAGLLFIHPHPPQSAFAGSAFSQQPVVRIEDVLGILVTPDNGRVITAARATATSPLQGTLPATTVNGFA